jgi:ferritin-like metal-binding protein YciE
MRLVIQKLPDLFALYVKQLRQILSAEGIILRGLPTLIESATDTQLKQGFESHQREVDFHIKRLQTILGQIAGNAEELSSKSMRALIDECEEMVQDATHDAVRDAALISSALRIQHDQIAAYGSALHFARVLERDSDAELLHSSLHEEQHTIELLESIAVRVNAAAKKAA